MDNNILIKQKEFFTQIKNLSWQEQLIAIDHNFTGKKLFSTSFSNEDQLITYIIAKLLIKINYLSLVNILMDKLVVKELIQSDLKKESLISELVSILDNNESIIKNYDRLISLLDKKGASRNFADFIMKTI